MTANALGPTSYSWLRCVLDWRIATVIAVLVSRDWNGRSVLGRGKCKRQPVLVSDSGVPPEEAGAAIAGVAYPLDLFCDAVNAVSFTFTSWALEVSPVAHACSEVWIAVVERLLLSHMLSVASLPRMPISSVHFDLAVGLAAGRVNLCGSIQMSSLGCFHY